MLTSDLAIIVLVYAQPPVLGLGLRHKVLRFPIANFLKKLKNVSQLTLGINHQDQSIGVGIAYTLLKLNFGKVDLLACMIASTIN